MLEKDSLQVVNAVKVNTPNYVATDNWWLIYKWFFLVGKVGKLDISKEWQISKSGKFSGPWIECGLRKFLRVSVILLF
jgi:hypothetical protein